MSTPVSVVLIARNAERTLARCLASTVGFDDVVMVDTGSTDATLAIAARYPHVRVLHETFEDFSANRNAAAACARHDWVCPLDTDEWFDPVLAAQLQAFNPASDRQVHAFWRYNWFLGRRLRSKLGREWIRRVYHRQQVQFVGAVHERLVRIDGGARPAVARLPGHVGHDPYASVGHLFEKRWTYARPDLRKVKAAHPAVASLRALWRFLRGWLMAGGFIDGWRGFVLASADASGVFLKYVWGYAARKASAERTQGA